jgi:hypothetical protein
MNTGLFTSNSEQKEWCAAMGETTAIIPRTTIGITKLVFMLVVSANKTVRYGNWGKNSKFMRLGVGNAIGLPAE